MSFADRTQGHEGYMYRAKQLELCGMQGKKNGRWIVDGAFIGDGLGNHKFGGSSPKVRQMFLHKR